MIRRLLRAISGPRTVTVRRNKFTGGKVGLMISETVPNFNDGVKRVPLDQKYWACSRDDFDRILNEDFTDKELYQKNRYDCEDFALTLMATTRREYGISTVGLVIDWSGSHAYNIVMFDDGSIAYLEPQEQEYVEPDPDSDGKYQLSNGVILI